MKTPLPDGSVDTAAGSFFSCRILIWQIPFELITDHPLVAGIARDFFAGFQRTSLSPKLVYRIEGRDLSLWRNGRRLRAWGDVLAVFPAFEGVLYSDLIYESDGLILHSAALLYGERAWLVSGESGAGKSTLAAQMTQAGFIYLGDEYSRVDINFGAEAMPRPLKLDEAPTTFKLSQAREVGYEFEHKDGSLQKSSMWLWDASLRATGRWPLGGIIMISHGKEKLSSLRRLSSSSAALLFGEEVRSFAVPDADLLRAISSRIPIYRLHSHSSDEARDALLRIVGNSCYKQL